MDFFNMANQNFFRDLVRCPDNLPFTLHIFPGGDMQKNIWKLKDLFNSSVTLLTSRNETLEALEQMAGKSRLQRICQRPELELDPNALVDEQGAITKEVLQKIWIGMADVRIEDIQEMGGIGSSMENIDAIYNKLLPSSEFKDIFLDGPVDVGYHDKAHSSGKKFKGLRERVWAALQHRHDVMSGMQNQSFADLELLTSRLGEREPPAGSVVRLGTGYYAADRIISGRGAYVTVWKRVSGSPHTIIACRGTASRLNATEGIMSAINDALPEIGFHGIRSIWPELKSYLEQNKIQSVDIMGKSLGGSHAQYLTALITGRTPAVVDKLQTCCSVGIPENVQHLFEKEQNTANKKSPVVEIYRNLGDIEEGEADFIPWVGGTHLHVPEKTRVLYALPGNDADEKAIEHFHRPRDDWDGVISIFRSLAKGHARQNSLGDYTLVESRNIAAEITVGKRLEHMRSFAATIFNAVTFGAFQTETFEEYYHANR